MPEANAGIGASGVPRGGQLETDLLALSDPAKRIAETRQAAVNANAAQNLAELKKGEAAQFKSLDDRMMAELIKRTQPTLEKDRTGYIKMLQLRAAELRTKAQDVKTSKTGNIQAEKTYQQAADLLMQRVIALQNEDVGAETQPATSQPAGGTQ